MNNGERITILVCDDHHHTVLGLKTEIDNESDLLFVGEASNGREAIAEARRLNPDVVLMDISMPYINGLIALEQITREKPKTAILMLTEHDEDTNIQKAVQKGASGYILKQEIKSTIAVAIREVVAGGVPSSAAVNAKLWDSQRDSDALTQRELEILQLGVKGYKDYQVAAKLYVAEKTVRNHWTHINTKLEAADRTAAMINALRLGIVDFEYRGQ